MVVVTRRLRTVVAPTSRVLDTLSTQSVVGESPVSQDFDEEEIVQEPNLNPTHTYFKPYSPPSTVSAAYNSQASSHQIFHSLAWLSALTAVIFLSLVVYTLIKSLPSFASPLPVTGIFQSASHQSPHSFSHLPNLPRYLPPTTLNLSPYLPFPSLASFK